MYNPLPIYTEGCGFFRYRLFDIPSKKFDSTHYYFTCCAEEGDKRCNMDFRMEMDYFIHDHVWVNISDHPFSRLPQIIQSIVSEKKERNADIDLQFSIVKCFTKLGVADMHVEDSAFKNMCVEIYKCNNNKPAQLDFISMLNKFNRKSLKNVKLNLASQRKKELFSKIHGEFINILADVGTYAGQSRLLCKISRPYEKKLLIDLQETDNYLEMNNFAENILSHKYNSTPTSSSPISSSSDLKIFHQHIFHFYNRNI
jgi:hypothetical protein